MIYYFILLKTIVKKDFLYLERYWLNSIFSIILISLFFLIFTYGAHRLGSKDGNINNLLSGYITWIFMTTIFSTLVTNTSNEASLGTLEQLYINSRSFYVTIIMQGLSGFLIIFIQISILVLIITILGFIPINIAFRYFLSLPFFILGVPALWGIGLLLAAIVLRYKNVTSIYTVLSSLLFGFISYISSFSYNWKYTLIPFAPASHYIQEIMSRGVYIDIVCLTSVLLNSTCFFIIGFILFRKYEEKSKNNANFAHH